MRSLLIGLAALLANGAGAATVSSDFGTGATNPDLGGVPATPTDTRSFYALLTESGRSLFSPGPATLDDTVTTGGSGVIVSRSGYRDLVGTVDTRFEGRLEFQAPERLTAEEAGRYNPLPRLIPATPLSVAASFAGEVVAEVDFLGRRFDFAANDLDLTTLTRLTNPSPAFVPVSDTSFQNATVLPIPGGFVLNGSVIIDANLETDTTWSSYEIEMLAAHRETGETQRRTFTNFSGTGDGLFDLGRPGWWDLTVDDVRLNIRVDGEVGLIMRYGIGFAAGFGCGDPRTPTDNGELCILDGVFNFAQSQIPLAGVFSEPDPQWQREAPTAALFVEGPGGTTPTPVPLPPGLAMMAGALLSILIAGRGRRRA